MSFEADVDLSDWQRAMGRFSAGVADRVARLLEFAAETVADDAERLVPRGPSGAARASLKAIGASVSIGGPRAPYGPWLEFGGRVGVNESVSRRVVPGGRSIWPSWEKNRTDILTAMERGLGDLAKESGLDVG